MQIRIKGLVRFYNDIREKLLIGVPSGELSSFRKSINKTVQSVEFICREYQTTPANLPGPSRNAYLFLKNIDMENLPVLQNDQQITNLPTVNLKSINNVRDYFSQTIWRDAAILFSSQEQREVLYEKILNEIHRIDIICKNYNSSPSHLSKNSLQVYCWLKFLATRSNFTVHLNTVDLVKKIGRNFSQDIIKKPVEVHLVNFQSIYRFREYSDCFLLKCHEGFIGAGEQVWMALLSEVLKKGDKYSKKIVVEFTESEDFKSVLVEMDSTAMAAKGVGQKGFHNLDKSFHRVNDKYFSGNMVKPNLTWNRLLTVSKMGHYQPGRDVLMISRTLDNNTVPEFVIDFVMFHELLHKKHGISLVNGRRYAHTREYRKEERAFEQYEAAQSIITRMAREKRGLPEFNFKDNVTGDKPVRKWLMDRLKAKLPENEDLPNQPVEKKVFKKKQTRKRKKKKKRR